MKYISLILLTSLFTGFAHAQKPGVRLNALALKGKVKQVTEYIYKDVEDINRLPKPEKYVKNFDENGNQLDETVYAKTGVIKKTIFTYTKGKITQLEYINGKLKGSYIQLYDDNGREIEIDMHLAEDTSGELPIPKMDSRTVFKYDKKGKKIEEDGFLNGTKLSVKTTFLYNEENQIAQEDMAMYFSTGVKKQKTINKYDSAGNIIKSSTYDLHNRIVDESNVTISNLDQNGNWRLRIFTMKMYSVAHGDSLFKDVTKREIVYFK